MRADCSSIAYSVEWRRAPIRPVSERMQRKSKQIDDDIIANICLHSLPRHRSAFRLLYGDSAPFLSLIGVSLATGGILTKDDELEGVCWEIREAVSRLQGNWGRETVSQTMTADFGLSDLDIGPPIAKGCAAVVYAAAIKEPSTTESNSNNESMTTTTTTNMNPPINTPQRRPDHAAQSPSVALASRPSLLMSPIQNTSRFVHNFGGSVDNLHAQRQRSYSTSGRSAIVDEYRRRSVTTTRLQRNRMNSAVLDESEYEREFNGAVTTTAVNNNGNNIGAGDGNNTVGEMNSVSAYPTRSIRCVTGVLLMVVIAATRLSVLCALFSSACELCATLEMCGRT